MLLRKLGNVYEPTALWTNSRINNTPSEVLTDIQNEVRAIYDQIVESDDWTQLSWLEQEAEGYRTTEKERKDFDWRLKKVKQSNICNYKGEILVEPQRESGVFALTLQLQILEKGLFPFYILDYDTHSGIDVIAKGDDSTPIQNSKLYYVEFKHYLTSDFNHSFSNLHNIICWDTTIKHDEVLKDIGGEERKLEIVQPADDKDYTRYILNNPRSVHKIEVFVLKDFLRQKLSIEFRPRTSKDTLQEQIEVILFYPSSVSSGGLPVTGSTSRRKAVSLTSMGYEGRRVVRPFHLACRAINPLRRWVETV